MRRHRRYLIAGAILVLALTVRIVDVQTAPYRLTNDGYLYLRLAKEITHHGDYAASDGGAGGARGPTAYFPPLYPYFLAGVDSISGHVNPRNTAIRPARIASAVLGTITVWLIGLVTFELFGETIALIAMGLAAIYPVFVELSGALVAENLSTPLIVAATWAVLRARRSARRWPWVLLAGVGTGLATLAHENAVLIVLPLMAGVWSAPRRSWRSWWAPAALALAAAAAVAPWTIRNAIVMHDFLPVADETGITLVGTYNPASAAFSKAPYKWRIFAGIPQDHHLHTKTMTEPGLSSFLEHQALRYIENHPTAPLAVAFHNTLRMFELEGSFAWQASATANGLPTGLARVGVFSFWLLAALALGGLFTRAARAAPKWFWGVPILLALSAVLVNMETPRFREPVDPFFILLAACAVESLARRLGGARKSRPHPAPTASDSAALPS